MPTQGNKSPRAVDADRRHRRNSIHHVEQDEVGGDALEELERFPAVAGHVHLEAELLYQELERQHDVRLVVCDQ